MFSDEFAGFQVFTFAGLLDKVPSFKFHVSSFMFHVSSFMFHV